MQECCHCREIINYSVYKDIILVDLNKSITSYQQQVSSVACVIFDGNRCRIHVKHFSQPWETVLWNRARQHRGSYPTLHTPLPSSSSSTHTEEKWLPSPCKLHVPCSPDPSQTCSCESRCLLQKMSPPHAHQEHSCPLPGKQLIPSFLPCAGSPHAHLSAAV